jgi:hypothetical protein
MATSPEWAAFQRDVEDSLVAVRTRERRLEGALALTQARLEWEQENRPTLMETYGPAAAVALAFVLGWSLSR